MDLINMSSLQLEGSIYGIHVAFDTEMGNILRPLREVLKEHGTVKIGELTRSRIVSESMKIYEEKGIHNKALISVQFQYDKHTGDFLLYIEAR